MAYNPSTGIITAPVSIYDVQRAIGSSHVDLKTLATRTTIKKWARFRPIEYQPSGANYYRGPLTESQRATVNYGIGNIPVWRSGKTISNVVNFWLGLNTGTVNRPNDYEASLPTSWWTMVLPSTVARLTDFVSTDNPTVKGYYNGAEPPIGQIASPSIVISANGNATIAYPMGLAGATAGLTITYSDLSVMASHSYAEMYFGVVIVIGNTIYLATQSNNVGPQPSSSQAAVENTLWSMGASVHIKVGKTSGDIVTAQSAKIFPVICASPMPWESTVISPVSASRQDTYIALQDSVTASVSIVYAGARIESFLAWKNVSQSNRLIYYSWTIKNDETDVTRSVDVKIEMLNSSGTVIGTSTTRTVTLQPGSMQYNGSIDAQSGGTDVYGLVTQLRITTSLNATLDQAVFKRSYNMLAAISDGPTPDS